METLLDSLQRQQAQIEDKEAFADMVMERIERVEDYIPRHYRGTTLRTYPGLTATPLRTYPGLTATPLKRGWGRLMQQNNSQFSIFNFQFATRVAASVALVVLVGFFVTLRTQPAISLGLQASDLHNLDKYRIDLSQIPTDGTSRDMYRCYQKAKREQTFYHYELINYSHENM